MKLFLILGNQLFNTKYLNNYKDHIFYMAEDYELCTFEKHHKLKILLFLSSMRSFKDELKSKNYNIIYKDINKEFKVSYIKKLDKIIRFSRENTRKGTKFIILKGQNAHIDSKLAFSKSKIRYKLEQSITDSKSKILFFESE